MIFAYEWLARLERGDLSARELVSHYLGRIDVVNPQINAAVTVDPETALAAADAADRSRAAGDRRPLLGLPVTIKDSLAVAGMLSTGGSFARADYYPSRDATAVKRLRDAGAIMLAKTNAPERSASYETDNAIFGRTNHPLDPERTPGGSSGGEAALSGADATPLGLGTDGGGSIRVPAHYCGVVGLRPTTGRVPGTSSVWPSSRASGYMDFACTGPIARCVEDVALALRLIAGPDGVDPYAVPAPLGNYAAVNVAGLRVGYFTTAPGVTVTPGTVSAVETATQALVNVGAQVVEVQPPWTPNPSDLFFRAIFADGGALLRTDVAGAGGRHIPAFKDYINAHEEYALSAAEWFALQREIYDLRAQVRALLNEVDVLLSPVAAGPAPLHGTAPANNSQEKKSEASGAFDFVSLFSIAGVPAASVPIGQEDGLPIGVQVAGAAFREDVVLAVARKLEEAH